MDVPTLDNSDVAFLQEIDNLVAQSLESIGFQELVNKKFHGMNEEVDQRITPVLRTTQDVFDEILEDVNLLEEEEKVLSKELHSLMAADVIVLDDDDDDDVIEVKPETPAPDKKTASASSQPKKDNLTQSPFKTEPKQEVDSLGLFVGLRVLAKKRTEWFPATIIDVLKQDNKRRYKVRFDMNRGKIRVLPNHLACLETPEKYGPGQIPAGSRIVADFKNEGIYSGVVAEAPDKKLNRGRFLVFYDDGYAMYCPVSSVYLVYGAPANVWEDISYRQTADYIKEYLSTSERPMLALKQNQVLKVEFQGEWHKARCVKVDSSLVEVMYLMDGSREWIYRGSLRLEPLFKQSHMKIKAQQNKSQRRLARAHTGVRRARIEYTTIDLTRDSSPSPSNSPVRDAYAKREPDERKKNVGKKSTGGVPKSQPQLQQGTQQNARPDGKWRAPWDRSHVPSKINLKTSPVTPLPRSYSEIRGRVDVASHILDRMSMSRGNSQNFGRKPGKNGRSSRSASCEDATGHDSMAFMRSSLDQKNGADSKKVVFGPRPPGYYMMIQKKSATYVKHTCKPKCVDPYKFRSKKLNGVNPLLKPLLLGWTREISRKHPYGRGNSFHVYYRTPCGRMCRNMADVDRYMIETGITDLDYDQFCFDSAVRTNIINSVNSRDVKLVIEDYADGKENIPVSCVNEINTEPPPRMPYTTKRKPGIGVRINTDTDFMICCDCPDNCRDRSKCPCQQLTVTATSCCKGARIKQDAGYSYKRLYNFLPTGIYECNPKCKCNMQCPNRVVQKGLQCRLQMFKTHKKGWGIRCLDDIAKGTFVCVYTGKIQNEEQANKEGLEYGDEYLAELDHIEVAERQKDIEDGSSSSGVDSEMDEDDEDDDKNGADKDKGDDSGANTTDSDLEMEDTRVKHVTVTLKRAPDSKWTVKSNDLSSNEDKASGTSTDSRKESSGNGKRRKQRGAGRDADSSDSDMDVSNGGRTKLFPPSRDHDDDDDETTDTDTDFSNNDTSRPPSTGPNSNKNQSFGLHSSRMSSDDKLSSDDEEHVSQTRKYFGCPDTYIIDAKQTGNLGRYLNHSCAPNLLVQNVFIDTHDLRFPWVAFFATTTIRAGTELTWDYNYEIGSVEGREIICYCGATKCRKRLL